MVPFLISQNFQIVKSSVRFPNGPDDKPVWETGPTYLWPVRLRKENSGYPLFRTDLSQPSFCLQRPTTSLILYWNGLKLENALRPLHIADWTETFRPRLQAWTSQRSFCNTTFMCYELIHGNGKAVLLKSGIKTMGPF